MSGRLAALVVVAVVALGGGGAARATDPAPTLALLYEGASSRLVRIDASLDVVAGKSLEVGWNTYAWSVSPDGSTVALAGDGGGTFVPELLLADVPSLRAGGRVRLARRGWVLATGWARRGLVRRS